MALLVVMGTRTVLGEHDFSDWGWRIPFLVSIVLLGISVWIRLALAETPAFQRMKARGRGSRAPVAESFGQWKNLKLALLALGGLTAGQAVVWYTGQFYALFFLTQQLQVDATAAQLMLAVALLLGTPFFIVFGALSDRVGRKPVILLGCALAAATYFPVFQALSVAANPALAAAQERSQVVVVADPADCSFQFNPTGAARFTSPCDRAKQVLATHSVHYANEAQSVDGSALVRIGPMEIVLQSSAGQSAAETRKRDRAFHEAVAAALTAQGYPRQADPEAMNRPMVVALLFYLMLLVTMVYGPIAAALAEMFPTRIRYTSMSLPYHIGNGWFGGLLPPMAFAIVAQTGDIYSGLWYPVLIAGATVVIGALGLRETRGIDMYADD